MGKLFDRKIAVSFGVKGSEGKKITDLRIIFEIEKTSESNPNTIKIQIFNLNKDSWAVLENTKSDLSIILELGYKDEPMEILFKGDITKASHTRQGADIVTTIEAGDGTKGLMNATLDKSYKAGTDEKNVIKDLVNTIKESGSIVVGNLSKLKTNISQNGLSISGMSKDLLDKLVKKQDLEWNIQDNVLQILEPKGNTGEEAIKLTPQTGLIGTPVKREDGIEFTALIQTTKMKPGRLIHIESRDITGNYRVRTVSYKGDTHGNEWYTICEAI